jgi:putative addiction module component (TIGR02574 family)
MDAALLKVIASLPRDEQLDLVEAVWDGLVANDEAPVITDAQRRVLDQRLDAMVREPDANLSWDEVCARVRVQR